MNCKNCGARLDDNSTICPNCGIKNGEFVLFAGDGREEFKEEAYTPKKNNVFLTIVSIIVSIAIVTGGGYFALTKYLNPPKPDFSFESGYGVINGDQPVIYVLIDDNSNLEYIHGVNLYAYSKTDDSSIGDVLTSDYEYTKSVDGTFRAIFFDASEFDVEEGKDNVYTFEMSFSFVDNVKIYTYTQTVEFPEQIKDDISDIIFDHSMDKESEEPQTTTESVQTTTQSKPLEVKDIKYIEEGFWFMAPYTDGEKRSITSIDFKPNGKCDFTHFFKDGNKAWKLSKSNGKYELKGSTIYVTDSEGMVETYTVDEKNKNINGLEKRKFNSTKNAEDFFGI